MSRRPGRLKSIVAKRTRREYRTSLFLRIGNAEAHQASVPHWPVLASSGSLLRVRRARGRIHPLLLLLSLTSKIERLGLLILVGVVLVLLLLLQRD